MAEYTQRKDIYIKKLPHGGIDKDKYTHKRNRYTKQTNIEKIYIKEEY